MKYFEMHGKFKQFGKFQPDNHFKGFVEIVDETYNPEVKGHRMGNIQLFRGIQIDQCDTEQKSHIILGILSSHEKFGREMCFFKLCNDRRMSPICYELKNNENGTYKGSWYPLFKECKDENNAELTKFTELTLEQVKEKNVLKFLKKGYSEIELPLQMQAAAKFFFEIEKNIRRHSRKLKSRNLEREITMLEKDNVQENHDQMDTLSRLERLFYYKTVDDDLIEFYK